MITTTTTKKKTLKTIKKELLNSLKKNINDNDERESEEIFGHIKNAEEAAE